MYYYQIICGILFPPMYQFYPNQITKELDLESFHHPFQSCIYPFHCKVVCSMPTLLAFDIIINTYDPSLEREYSYRFFFIPTFDCK